MVMQTQVVGKNLEVNLNAKTEDAVGAGVGLLILNCFCSRCSLVVVAVVGLEISS